ncbi:MAG TPA: DUF6600 domain-containing protein [Paludibacter sp.]
MKSNIKIFALLLVLTTSCLVIPRQTEAQQTNVSFQVFYDQLSPYGQWINYSNYGYVWIPDTGSDFVPYSTDGHWILTNYGWTWASDYNWGWAAFHYGRWSFNDSFGWFWVPDNEWGPAWVNWRQADGYYGWSPMEPGISISMSFGREYDSRNDHWMFVRDRDFERSDINQYYVNQSDRDRIVRNSTVINRTYIDNSRHTTYVTGPTRNDVQRATGRTINALTIYENDKPGQQINNGQLRIYRPQIERNNSGRKTAPTRVTNLNDVKRTPVNDARNQNQIGNPGSRPVTQPINTVTPQNNNVQPVQQRNVNQQNNNRPVRQSNVVNPQNNNNNNNNNVQPIQQRNVNQQENSRQEQKATPPVNQNRNIQSVQSPRSTLQNDEPQPVQQRNVNQQDNNRPVRQPDVVNPQNNNVQPVQQREVNPQNNNSQPVQQRNVNQQDNKQEQRTPAPAKIENKPQPVQRQNVNPSNNNNNRSVKESKPINQQVKKEQDKIENTSPIPVPERK